MAVTVPNKLLEAMGAKVGRRKVLVQAPRVVLLNEGEQPKLKPQKPKKSNLKPEQEID